MDMSARTEIKEEDVKAKAAVQEEFTA